ncbi:MAG: bifunctional riboflavin kinase/FAD synthetase [Lachnospiraceae bacterium]|nr:bifunctional riboflavin kinase/FAD synthetase [Lachnospiraceae bacterium]
MHVYNEELDFKLEKSAVTLGKFDGIHLGHKKLINEIVEAKEKKGLSTVLFSFDTSGIKKIQSITTKEERELICNDLNIDNIIFFPVNPDTMSIEPEEFIEKILVKKINAKVVVTGKDFRFGKNRRGDVDMLLRFSKKCGYELKVVDNVMDGDNRVSSSNIKQLINEANITKANEMLGYSYFVYGIVERGKQIGRTIDRRTVNIIPNANKIIPPNGVYKTTISIAGKQYKSITNIGKCPTVRNDGGITIETHIFDFDEEIYDSKVKISFERFIRKERKFDSLEELRKQINLDILEANS